MSTAVLVDAGFFLKRYRHIFSNSETNYNPQKIAKDLHLMCMKHLSINCRQVNSLYRIFVYDCPPLAKKVHNPISKRAIDFSKTPEAIFRKEFHSELIKLRKVALRLGKLSEHAEWMISPEQTKSLFKDKIQLKDLTESDLFYNVKQKGVDMKIGLDIATLTYKKLVDQIILIAGDSDFVSAAKLARKEGIDFILDPMWNPINPDLHEHIDGLMSVLPNPSKNKILNYSKLTEFV
jgi:uncharacterized LabA/DUF88 family protein